MQDPPKERPLGIELLRLSLRHWKFVATVVVAAVLAAVVFTMPVFVDPQYRAEAVFYPAGANTSAGLLGSDMRFGFDRDVDNAMQVLQSSIVRDSLVRKYDLLKHYEIDPANPRRAFLLIEAYNDNVSVERTRYNSIQTTVTDIDPQIAAGMANDLVRLGDRVKAEIIHQNLRSAYQTVAREMRQKMGELTQLADSINHLRRKNYQDALQLRSSHFGRKQQQIDQLRHAIDRVRTDENIYDLDKQYDASYETYMTAMADYLTDSGMVAVMTRKLSATDTALIRRQAALAGARLLVQEMKHKLQRLNHSGARYNQLLDSYTTEKNVLAGLQGDYEFALSTFDKEYENLQLSTLKNKYLTELELYKSLKAKYELALSNLTDQVPASYVISPAEVPTRPVAPRRFIIAMLVGVSAFLLTILGLLVAENRETIRRELA